MRAFRHRDFRLLWTGAFLSFIGSMIQSVAQGWVVYAITGSEEKLALVAFFGTIPVSVLGPFAGTLSDMFDRRMLLNLAQILFALAAFAPAIALYSHVPNNVLYSVILTSACVGGAVAAFEMPTRQSTVSRVVPFEDLPSAIPINAMAFNLARVVGPAIGAILLANFGVAMCYTVNGISFVALIGAVLAIRANLKATRHTPQPMGDLIMEGLLYTVRSLPLRTLLILEAVTSALGLFYITLMPAYVDKVLGVAPTSEANKVIYGHIMTAVGIGAVTALALLTIPAAQRKRTLWLKMSMTFLGMGLVALALTHTALVAYMIAAAMGLASVLQFNITNTLFQLLSPERLRGRTLSMHSWALVGLAPFGTLIFGWIAQAISVPVALEVGGACVLAGALYGWGFRRGLAGADGELLPAD